MLVQFATFPGRNDRPNEDFVGAFPDCAVLLDGSGGPSELPSGCSHGVPWYVRQLGTRLLADMETNQASLTEILAKGITSVGDLHHDSCDLKAPGTPASIVLMARAVNDEFEYLVLGDSTLAIETHTDGMQVITDRRIDQVATAERLRMENLPVGTPEHQDARIRFVELQRTLRNKPDGYWIASTDPKAADQALTGSVPLRAVRRASLLSDGVTRFVEFGLGDWRDLMEMLDSSGPASVFERIREAENGDPDGKRWPRAKQYDDVAVVHFTRNGWRPSGGGHAPELAGS